MAAAVSTSALVTTTRNPFPQLQLWQLQRSFRLTLAPFENTL